MIPTHTILDDGMGRRWRVVGCISNGNEWIYMLHSIVGPLIIVHWPAHVVDVMERVEPTRPANKVIEVITEFDAIGNWCRVALTVDGRRFFMEHCSEHPDDAEAFAEVLRKALGITGDSDAE